MDWLDILAVQGTLKSLFQHHSSKASILQCSAFFMVQLSHVCMTTGKTIALSIWTFVGKVMPLLFNILSRFVIAFLLRNNHLLISSCSHHPQWFQNQEEEICHYFHFLPFYLPWNDETGCHDLSFIYLFLILRFKPAFSLSSFTLIKRFFSSSLLSAMSVVSSLYLRLLIFLPAILIPACKSSSPGYHTIGEPVSCSIHCSYSCFLTGMQVSQETG